MSNQESTNDIPDSVEFTATKALWRNLGKEVSTRGAICELIDNAIDSHERHQFRDEVTIELDHDLDQGVLRVVDDAGGIPPEDLEAIFSLGLSVQQEEHADSIGWAGIGLKRAAVALGHRLVVRSRFEYADNGAELDIDIDEWLDNENKREYDVTELTDIDQYEGLSVEKGTTVIEIHNLNFDFEQELDLSGRGGGDESVDPLDEYLASTYDLYLSDDLPESRDTQVTIELQGTQLTPEFDLPYSFSPFDGLFPRVYPNLLLSPDTGDYEGDVLMDVRVGLLTRASPEESGVTLYANGRKILANRTDEEAGFGTRSGLPEFDSAGGHNRLVIRADMRSLETAEDLPFNTSKTGINPDDNMAREAHRKIKNATKAYFDAKTAKVPITLLKPYPETSPYAALDGQWRRYSYTARQRIDGAHKPGKKPGGRRVWQYPDTNEFKQHLRIHAKLGIAYPDALEEAKRPAYLGMHSHPGSDLTEAEAERLNMWSYPPDLDHDDRRNAWYYTDKFDGVEDSFKGELERHFERHYQDEYLAELVLVESGPEDDLDWDDLDELEEEVEEVIDDLESDAEDHASADFRVAAEALAEWKRSTYEAALKKHHGENLDDLEVVESWGGAQQRLEPDDSDGPETGSNDGHDSQSSGGKAGQNTASQKSNDGDGVESRPDEESGKGEGHRIILEFEFTEDQLELLTDRHGDLEDKSPTELADLWAEDAESAERWDDVIEQAKS